MSKETIKISIKDAEKLGVSWKDICEVTGYDYYALREGLSEKTIVELPTTLFK